MHDAPRFRIEGVPPVQDRKVVPHQQIAHVPFVAHRKLRLRRVRPERVEQRFALGEGEPDDVTIRPAAEEERLAAGRRIGAHERMSGADGLPHIGDFRISLAQETGAVARGVVNRDLALDRCSRSGGSASYAENMSAK
jgi:hypothetical protein